MTEGSEGDELTTLVLATTYPRWEGDTAPKFVADLSEKLVEDGHRQIVLAPHHPGAASREVINGVEVRRFPYFVPKRLQCLCYDGGVLESIKGSHLALLQAPFLALSLLAHTALLLYREDIDVVHSHWLVPNALAAAMLRQVFSFDHVVTLHAGGVHGISGLPAGSYVAQFVYRSADLIAPVSTHIRDEFASMVDIAEPDLDPMFHVQPMGADTEDYSKYTETEAKQYLGYEDVTFGLFVGRIAEKKGVRFLVEALEQRESDDDLRLAIVGTGPLEDELRARVARSDAEDQIIVTGYIAEEQLIKYYCAADFVVVPSVEAESGDTEGMPTVIAEAFAAGCPVLASDVGGISDVVRHEENGVLVPPESPEAIADQIDRLIADGDFRQSLASSARNTASELNWDAIADQYADLLAANPEPSSSDAAIS